MPNGFLGSRGSKPGEMLLGWLLGSEETITTIINQRAGASTPKLYYRVEEPSGSTVASDYYATRPGVYTGAVTFETGSVPSGGAISIPSGGSLKSTSAPLNASNGYFGFWYKATSFPSSEAMLFGFVDSSSVYDKTVTLSPTGVLKFTAYDGATKSISSPGFLLNRWNHIVVNFGGGNGAETPRADAATELWLNGVRVAFTTTIGRTRTGYTSNNNIHIGGGGVAPFDSAPGKYDEIFIGGDYLVSGQTYYAGGGRLSANDVRAIYDAGRSSVVSASRVTNQSVDVVRQVASANAKVTQQHVEVLRSDSSTVRVSSIAIEVLRQTAIGASASVGQTLSFTQTVAEEAITNPPKAVTNTLTFTQTVGLDRDSNWYAESVAQTLGFTQTTAGINAGKSIAQSLAYTETVAQHFSIRNESILQTLAFTQGIDKSGSTLSQSVGQFLSFVQSTPAFGEKSLLQTLSFVQTVVGVRAKFSRQILNFTQTVSAIIGLGGPISHTLTFTQTVKVSRPIRINQTLALGQSVNMGMILVEPCDRGTLGNVPTGDIVLGVECGPGGPNGFGENTLAFTDTLALQRVYHRTVVQTLSLVQTLGTPRFIRKQAVAQTLTFFEKDFPKFIAIGNGAGTIYQQPVLIATIIKGPVFQAPPGPGPHYPISPSQSHPRMTMTFESPKGVITLPAPVFDDSEKTNNKLQIQKVMSTKSYSYVKRVDRLTLTYEWELSRRKSLELQSYYAFNQSDYIILRNWKGQIYFGKFGNNPIELSTTGRNNDCDKEFVTVSIEFQGVRIHG